MNGDVIIPSTQVEDLQKVSFDGDKECGAWALFSKMFIKQDAWTGKSRKRYILNRITPFKSSDIESSSSTHITVHTESFIHMLKEADDTMVAGFIHGHPSGLDKFSTIDDQNERNLLSAVQNRNGTDSNLVSLLVLPTNEYRARCWSTLENFEDCSTTVTGQKYQRFNIGDKISNKNPVLDRQARIFGTKFNQTIQKLRVLIVGAGGTGSSLAVMLARAGVKFLAIIDPDIIEETNLHRLYGARFQDVGKAKSTSLADYIETLGIGTEVRGIKGNILDPEHVDLLKSADIIFSATDDNAGRMLLNRFAYFYETPVIDLGLASDISDSGEVRDITGRVSLLYPGSTCLLCRDIIDVRRAGEEELQRKHPDMHEAQLKEGYIMGGGDPEPAFISMTTATACMALDEFTQMVSGFRGNNRNLTQRIRRFHIPEDRIMEEESNSNCPICGSSEYWGVGDVKPFLDRMA